VGVIVLGVFVEIAIAVLALVAPRAARVPLALLVLGFIALLVHHVSHTDATCGCFGGAQIPASVMLGADIACVALLAWTFAKPPAAQPVRRALAGALAGLVLGGAAAAFAHARLSHAISDSAPQKQSAHSAQPTPTPPDAVPSIPNPVPAPPIAWRMPSEIPEQVLLRPLQWMGKPIGDTPLGTWVDTSGFPAKARLVFFYKSCNHCAALLKELAEKQAADPASAPTYVLVQLPTPAAYKGKLFVDTVPKHALWVELPSVIKAYVMTPPWLVDIDGGKVVHAERIPWPGEKGPGEKAAGK
jgi:hypothetical protein